MSDEALMVKDCMSKAPPSVPAGTPLTTVIEKLSSFRVGGVPVVNDDKEVIGFVSEHDCISKILQSSYYCEPNAVVEDVMTAEPETVEPGSSLTDLAERMLTSRRQVFPVIEDGKLCGLITRSMVLVALKDKLQDCKSVY
jgi:CBS domain-containing protein